MYTNSIIIAVFALCLSITDARPGAPGNMNAAATGSTYQIEGLRNDISAAVTQDAIGASVATNKAFMASSVGTKAALAASDRSVALKSFDKLNRGNRKILSNGAAGGMAPGNNNARGTGNTYMIEGQRNELASAATHDAIYMAADKVSAFAASAFGTKAAISATERSVAVKTFDRLNAQGNRKLQQTNDRGDLVLLSQQTAHNSILKTVESEHLQASVKAAAAKNMEVAKLANKSGTWAMQFNDNRRHLHQATERDVRAIMSEQQISAQIDKASSGGSVKTATTKGLSFAKLTASISARPAEFSP